jgi:hypothetical protein
MKTLKKSGVFKRVPDGREDLDKIAILLKKGWNYCSKSEWKESMKKESNKDSKKKESNKE